MILLSAAAASLGVPHQGNDVEVTGVGSDSRTIMPGMLFVALRGDRFDGHDYVRPALQQGAAAAMVDRAWAAANPNLPLIPVIDTREALGQLAAAWRRRFAIPVLGITGSNGKTTVKEMCAAILRADFGLDAVLATTGNLNNDIGMPLTLLKIRGAHRAAVIEMGMNHAGEITRLTHIAQPTVALVNNAQRAHLAGLGAVGDVARAKGEIFSGLGPGGVAVINADDPHCELWRGMNAGRRILSFGIGPAAEVRGEWQEEGFGGQLRLFMGPEEASVKLAVPGEHNGRNALAAAAVCSAAGVPLAPIVRGLEGFAGQPGRLQKMTGRNGALVVDDSYNANPDSMRAAIDVLAAMPGRRIYVMGDMGEVGTTAGQLHDEIGGYAKSQGIENLFALGEKSAAAVRNFGSGAHHFASAEALASALLPLLDRETTVLVKGSRFMRMERVVSAIVEQGNAS